MAQNTYYYAKGRNCDLVEKYCTTAKLKLNRANIKSGSPMVVNWGFYQRV